MYDKLKRELLDKPREYNYRVFDTSLANEKPETALKTYERAPNLLILACGGKL